METFQNPDFKSNLKKRAINYLNEGEHYIKLEWIVSREIGKKNPSVIS